MASFRPGIPRDLELAARRMEMARKAQRVARDKPQVWFTSPDSFSTVLSAGNRLVPLERLTRGPA